MKNSLSRPEKLSASVLLFSINSNCQTRNCPPRKTVRPKLSQNSQSPEKLSFAGLLWLPTTDGTICSWGFAGCYPVEPRCCCCGLRTFPSAPKPQLTYSFCYGLAIYSRPYFSLNFLFSIFCRVGPESRRRNEIQTVEPRETVCQATF